VSYVEAILNKRTGGLVERDEKATTPITLDSLPVIRTDNLHVKKALPALILEGTESGARSLSLRENAGNFELYDITGGAVRHAIRGTDGFFLNDIAIEKNIPALRLKGTETGAKDLQIRENAGLIEIFDTGAGTKSRDFDGSCIRAGTVPKDALAANAIRLEIPVPLGYIPTGLATDSTGVKFESKQYLVSSDLLACAKAAYFESDLQQLTGGTVALELYDYTAAVVMASLSLSATTKRARSDNILASLVAGNYVGVRFNVTTAGAAGSVGGGCSPVLIIVVGIS